MKVDTWDQVSWQFKLENGTDIQIFALCIETFPCKQKVILMIKQQKWEQ